MRIWKEHTVFHAVPLQHFANLEKFSENKSRNAYQFMHCLEHGSRNGYRNHQKHTMINPKRSTQDWSVGSTVMVVFLTLTITAVIPTPGDGLPDEYRLVSASGKRYAFTPYFGLERI